MTFRDIIEGMHRKEPAIRAGALAGSDGLAVEEWSADPGLDMTALCAEMIQVFKEAGRMSGEQGLGGASEAMIAGDGGAVFLRKVTEEYFLLVVTSPDAIPGKCRFFLRNGASQAREIL